MGSRRGVAAALDKKYPVIQRQQANTLEVIPESETKPLIYSTIAKYGLGGTAESQELEQKEATPALEIRTYKWRWVVLSLYFFNNLVLNYVWIMDAPVANLITCYYGVSDTMVNLLTTSYMITYTLMVIPVAWAMERYGLRVCVVVGSAVIALGASIKVVGSGSSYYWVVMLGQFITSTSNSVFFGGPPLLSEVWFPSSERATATALSAAIAPQIGILIALGLSPIITHSPLTDSVCNHSISSTVEEQAAWHGFTYSRLLYYQSGVAALAILTFIATFLWFNDAPPTPPSQSRLLENNSHHDNANSQSCCQHFGRFLMSALLCLKNGYFILFLMTSGIIIAASGTVVSIINEVVLAYFPGKDEQVGYLGLASQGAALVSMLLIGRILDWTKTFYFFNVTLSIVGAMSVAALAVLLLFQHHFYLLYVAIIAIGASLASYQAVCYEYAVEMTYPLPETASAGLLNVLSQILSVLMILLVTPRLMKVALWFIVGITVFGAVLAVFTRPKLRRAEIDKNGSVHTYPGQVEEGEGEEEA